MAERNYDSPDVHTQDGIPLEDGRFVRWQLTADGDVGQRFKMCQYNDKTLHIQCNGNYNSASVGLRGSNLPDPDPNTAAHWFNLTNQAGTQIAFTSNGGAVVLDNPIWVSPL